MSADPTVNAPAALKPTGREFCPGVAGRTACDSCGGRFKPSQPRIGSLHQPWPFEPCPHYLPQLPHDYEHCAGFASEEGHEACPRRSDCARFRSSPGPNTPFAFSACHGGDRFIHVATVAQPTDERHPYPSSSCRVLDGNTSTPTEG